MKNEEKKYSVITIPTAIVRQYTRSLRNSTSRPSSSGIAAMSLENLPEIELQPPSQPYAKVYTNSSRRRRTSPSPAEVVTLPIYSSHVRARTSMCWMILIRNLFLLLHPANLLCHALVLEPTRFSPLIRSFSGVSRQSSISA